MCVCVCVSSCNWLKLETTAQLHSCWQSIWYVLRKQLYASFLSGNFAFLPNKKENLLQWLNKHWNTTCSEYVHAGCVTHVKNTTGLSKASNHTIKSHTNPVKLGVLRVLWQFKHYSTIQNHWEPKRAENTVKKSKKTKLWATCDYLPSLIVFCLWFLWGLLVAHRFRIRKDSCNIPVLFNETESLHVIYEIKWHSGAGSTNY